MFQVRGPARRCHRLFRLLPSRRQVSRFVFIVAAIWFFHWGGRSDLRAQSPERPNVILIMTDDQGYWDTGVSGNPHIDTPSMDRLAEEGIQLNRYYASPVCSLTRAGLMTGRYYLRTGLYNTRFGGDSLGLNEITVAQLLKQAGYRTGLFGKWHLGKYPGYQPQQRGFDEFFGHYHGHVERYENPDQVYHNGKPVEARGYVSDVFTTASMDFIEHAAKRDQKPFFCALMYNAPHSPFLLDTSHYGQAEGDKLLVKYLERGLPIREARIYALVERVDQNIGRLLEHLDKLKLADNTLVAFVSDNGGVSQFWKGGMRGNKGSVFEGGVRTPCFIRWPNQIKAGRVSTAQTSHIDWLPTLCELAGATLPKDRIFDGQSFRRLLSDESIDKHHDFVYHTWDRYFPNPERRWAVSDGRWKLMCSVSQTTEPSRRHWRLYDLQSDPSEERNLVQKSPEQVERLRSEFLRWFEEATSGQEYAPVPIPLGSESEDTVEIEPSWATWKGKHIRYEFDGYDWDSIEGWKTPGESATWNLDVKTSGTYRVGLTYGCRPLDAGGQCVIQSGDESIEYTTKATATADQYESRWAGEIFLSKGSVALSIRVKECPGGELMRLNRVTLERMNTAKSVRTAARREMSP